LIWKKTGTGITVNKNRHERKKRVNKKSDEKTNKNKTDRKQRINRIVNKKEQSKRQQGMEEIKA